MKFFKVSLLCCVLSGLSAMAVNAAGNPVDTYLQDPGTASAANNYGILTPQGKFTLEWKKAAGQKNGNRLATAAVLAESHVGLVLSENKEGDNLKAARSIDRLSVATNLLREGKATQKATVATNKQYLSFTYTKAANLAARLGLVKDLNSVFGFLSQDFGVNAKGCKTAEDKLHFQLAALTLVFYAEMVKTSQDTLKVLMALAPKQEIVTKLSILLSNKIYSSFIGTELKAKMRPYQAKATALYSDPKQRFFEVDDDGNVLSAPRALFLAAHTPFEVVVDKEAKEEAQKNPIVAAIKAAEDASDKAKETNLWGKVFVQSLRKNFLINVAKQVNTVEQWQTMAAIYVIALPEIVSTEQFTQDVMDFLPSRIADGMDKNSTPLIQYVDDSLLRDNPELQFNNSPEEDGDEGDEDDGDGDGDGDK